VNALTQGGHASCDALNEVRVLGARFGEAALEVR